MALDCNSFTVFIDRRFSGEPDIMQFLCKAWIAVRKV